MKRITLLLLFIFFSCIVISQDWLEFTPMEAVIPECTVITSNDTLVEFEVIIPGLYYTEVDSFYRVEILEHLTFDSTGYPEVPKLSYLVAIPKCDSIIINVSKQDSVSFEDFSIYPSPKIVIDTTDEGYTYLLESFSCNDTAYSNNSYFPGYLSEVKNKGAIRAQNCVNVLLYPVQFNPVLKEIMVYSKMKVTLTFSNPTDSINKNVGIFSEIVGNSLINYKSNGLNASINCGAGLQDTGSVSWVSSFPNDYINVDCDYLIITHDSLIPNQAAKDTLEKLADHRAEFNGFDVSIVKMDDIINLISGNNISDRIYNLIKNTYDSGYAANTYDGKLAYVNLFGDAYFDDTSKHCVPTYPFDDTLGYDKQYSQLTPNILDPYPDLMIGRCSVDTLPQIQNVVNKTINFKPNTLGYKNNFYSVIGVHGDTLSYPAAKYGINALYPIIEADSAFLSYPTYNFNNNLPFWEPIPYSGSNYTPVHNRIALGAKYYNYTGHGEPGHTAVLEYDDLTSSHEDKIFFMVLQACKTGRFFSKTIDDCMTEQFLNQDDNKGAIGVIGAGHNVALFGPALYLELFKSHFKNYAYVSGECFMEMKLSNSMLNDNTAVNYFGDPAVNLMYENIDTIRPDIIVKSSDIRFDPDTINVGDTVNIDVCVRNITTKDFTDTVNIGCRILTSDKIDTVWNSTLPIYGLDGYELDTVTFQWNTSSASPITYSITIEADIYDDVTELNETNNSNTVGKKVYFNSGNFPISFPCGVNSYPISFDINSSYTGEELIYGGKHYSNTGSLISSTKGNTYNNTSITDQNNNNSYQVINIVEGTSSWKVRSIGTPSWTYTLPSNIKTIYGPYICDFDVNGQEEVIVMEEYNNPFPPHNFVYRIRCINSTGTLKWVKSLENDKVYYEPGIHVINEGYQSLFCADESGKIMIFKESEDETSLVKQDSIIISNCDSLYYSPIVSDLNHDGYSEYILYASKLKNNVEYDSLFMYKEVDSTFSSKHITVENYKKPIIADLNNDGDEEILMFKNNHGIVICNNQLDSIRFVSDQNLNSDEIVSGDFNDDGNNDILYQSLIGPNNWMLNIYCLDDSSTTKINLLAPIKKIWISDVDNDDKLDILYSSYNQLFLLKIPAAGSSIGWPGQRGNFRNSGVIRQPPYLPEDDSNDTVYWYNTMLISDSLGIPNSTSVIIKPCSQILADTGVELSVMGRLIANGDSTHPIHFKAMVNDPTKEYWEGITLKNNSNSSFKHNRISDAEFGLLYEDYSSQTLEDSYFTNNTVGVGAYNTSPVLKRNILTTNEIGLGVYSNGSPYLSSTGEGSTPYENGIINNDTGIYLNASSIYMNNGYNDIYHEDTTHTYYIYKTNDLRITASNNYWGSSDTSVINDYLYPSDDFLITPVCTTAQSNYKNSNPVEYELLQDALEYLINEEYSNAENTFKSIINTYPDSPEAYQCIPGIYAC